MAVLLGTTHCPPSPSPIGFEGFEKRLEITFSEAPMFIDPLGRGLRALTRVQLDSILDAACCTIVDQLSNSEFDSYVLSESSLFLYPLKMILKTCGTTKLLQAIPPILEFASSLSLSVSSVKYSRGTFIFPDAQPSPHGSFTEEVEVLNGYLGNLASFGRAYVIGDPLIPNWNWHIYAASQNLPSKTDDDADRTPVITLEMCMTELDRDRAAVFYKKSEDDSAKKMTKLAGIADIMPTHELCDFDFEPCGYSMNAIDGGAFSTIHVTPEDGFSYASYEAMGFDPGSVEFEPLIQRVLRCFRPAQFSVAVTSFGGTGTWGEDDVVEGYACSNVVKQELPGGGCVVYRYFTVKEQECALSSPKSTLHCWEDLVEEVELFDKMKVEEESGAISALACPCVSVF
ncbi:S-adenosylmethionine decarboxylase proenzyme-like [Macadamia integrifolia]|uniref:S-adenosylmethionine decarboxylase proenzyme-like n=1 Tax=Macadamia integrifolia TaxID=60698 RepID=UPI001C4F4284|nr:S-adenosylmethionine decarboxylase proenzyme-like [Macadamia integrifolia]XP_042503667.1 S-adenosylmethionine decarboxylase proenzyme-like [Macadamia integrifolia]XP_042503668.1 S-adenosylmethionine decarboxylase proenzyme-like [Macadamia integrifolia]